MLCAGCWRIPSIRSLVFHHWISELCYPFSIRYIELKKLNLSNRWGTHTGRAGALDRRAALEIEKQHMRYAETPIVKNSSLQKSMLCGFAGECICLLRMEQNTWRLSDASSLVFLEYFMVTFDGFSWVIRVDDCPS